MYLSSMNLSQCFWNTVVLWSAKHPIGNSFIILANLCAKVLHLFCYKPVALGRVLVLMIWKIANNCSLFIALIMFIAFHTSVAFLFVYLFSKLKNASVTVLGISDHPHSSWFLFISNVIIFDSGLSYFQTQGSMQWHNGFLFWS